MDMNKKEENKIDGVFGYIWLGAFTLSIIVSTLVIIFN